jgi:predicted O-methyltransferase YrrM
MACQESAPVRQLLPVDGRTVRLWKKNEDGRGVEMKPKPKIGFAFISSILILSLLIQPALAEKEKKNVNLDEKVKRFLENHRGQWVDWNVPEVDGKVLYDLIVKNNYKKAVEIGTSTGHSAIKLITIEIHEGRYKKALANFKAAGLSEYIDARLADAHKLVKEIEGPFDFVFTDADKEWYKNYFTALAPKLEVGGCFTAHNVSSIHWKGIGAFLEYVQSLPNFETTIDKSSQAGISISFKKAE